MLPGVLTVTDPDGEPISLEQAKAQLRVEHASDDALINLQIAAARDALEGLSWRLFVQRELELTLPEFPACGEIELPYGNLSVPPGEGTPPAVTSVKYLDADGVERTLATTEYDIDPRTDLGPGRIVLAYGKAWPGTRCVWNAVKVRYWIGWAAADVPALIKAAIQIVVSQMYEFRTLDVGEALVKCQGAVDWCLSRYTLAGQG